MVTYVSWASYHSEKKLSLVATWVRTKNVVDFGPLGGDGPNGQETVESARLVEDSTREIT